MDALTLYDSYNRKKRPFIPINPPEVKLYVCGMTVYDYCHIGHARVMVVFDLLARHLRKIGYKLHYVRNITDIDDKIIKRAQENQEPIEALTSRFIKAMHEDECALKCLPPDQEPRATEHMAKIQELIAKLVNKNLAYRAENGDVYYRTRQFKNYGKLANRKLDELQLGERIAINPNKEDPLDFVLWKASKEGEPYWPSPWGNGRPGWHIECSAMNWCAFGEQFDIHGGGMDLKFPHHECEIAQSEGAFGKKMVNYWLHNGFVQIDEQKMSKSLGNFFTIRDVLKKYNGEAIRLFMLQTHYRAPLNYSDHALDEAKKALTRLYHALEGENQEYPLDEESQSAFLEAMNDDLNTPKALSILFNLTRRINSGETQLKTTLKTLGQHLGLLNDKVEDILRGQNHSTLNEEEIQALIEKRQQAKKDKNYAEADRIRARLKEAGILLRDTPEGVQWSYE